MGNYRELQKYLENSGKTEIKLSFDNLKNILILKLIMLLFSVYKRNFNAAIWFAIFPNKRNGLVFAKSKRKTMTMMMQPLQH